MFQRLAAERIYRSRSALNALSNEVRLTQTGGKSQWQAFERDVGRLMETMGFTVHQKTASHAGDLGIDVYATKVSGGREQDWVIQCKCWRADRAVGPNIVRELVGTLELYSNGAQGMIATTSNFSTGAVAAAEAAGILLINGKEFVELLSAT